MPNERETRMSTITHQPRSGSVSILFKSCPRCQGDRSLQWDYDGWYVLCLMCGHVSYPDVPANSVRAAEPQQIIA